MESTCFYFQVHQPFRLRDYDFSMIGEDHVYEEKNAALHNYLAESYYLPTNRLLLNLLKKYKNKLKIVFSISGCAIEQFALYRPDVLVSFQKLAKTGKVDFLAQTYYHSLSLLYSASEFERQVKKHHDKMTSLFGRQPKNLLFNNNDNICLDYETFEAGKYNKYLSGYQEFDQLLNEIMTDKQQTFALATVAAQMENSMQKEAIKRIYSLEEKVLKSKNENLIDTWGRLQTSDYFHYMSTKITNDNDVRHWRSPYSSPFDAYINYMNIISDFEHLLA